MRTERAQEKKRTKEKSVGMKMIWEGKKQRLLLTNCGGNVGGGVVRFLEAVLEVSGDPHGGKWTLSRQKGLRIEHGSVLDMFDGTMIREDGGREFGFGWGL